MPGSFGENEFGATDFGDPEYLIEEVIVDGRIARLSVSNGTPYEPALWDNIAYCSWNKRNSDSNPTVEEAFVDFDIPANVPAGKRIVSCQLIFDVTTTNGFDTSPNRMPFYLAVQNKAESSVWELRPSPPWYDDFSRSVWNTIIQTTFNKVPVGEKSTIYFNTSSVLDVLVGSWLSGIVEWKNGIIIGLYASGDAENTIENVKLKVLYTDEENNWIPNYLNNKKV